MSYGLGDAPASPLPLAGRGWGWALLLFLFAPRLAERKCPPLAPPASGRGTDLAFSPVREGKSVKLGRLNHIGVAVPDLDAAIAHYRDVMGATDITEPFVLDSQQVRVCFVNTPGEGGTAGTQIELLQPTVPDSAGRQMAGEEPARRAAPHLLRSARYPCRQGLVRKPGQAGAGRAAHRRAWHADLLRASQGHGRAIDRDHGNAPDCASNSAGTSLSHDLRQHPVRCDRWHRHHHDEPQRHPQRAVVGDGQRYLGDALDRLGDARVLVLTGGGQRASARAAI